MNISSGCSTPPSNVSFSLSSNEPDTIIIIEDDDDDDDDDNNDEIDIDQTISDDNIDLFALKNIFGKLQLGTELFVVRPDLPVQLCTLATAYPHLESLHFLIVNLLPLSTPECLSKQYLYLSESFSSMSIPRRTRIYNRTFSLGGFIFETPCSIRNQNRYLVLYDNFTALYHQSTDFHLCLSQDFSRHVSAFEYENLREYYRKVFQRRSTNEIHLSQNQIIRVRKFGSQFHNVRIIDEDRSLICICFYERKSQSKQWIHRNSPMIDFSSLCSSSSSSSLSEIVPIDSARVRTRKRESHQHHPVNEARKRLRDRSNNKQLAIPQRQSSPPLSFYDETNSAVSRANMLNIYYTNVLLPKFRILNSLPLSPHECSSLCVELVEKNFSPNRITTNPFLLPFECKWSIIESKPRAYRSPCRRIFNSFDDIERYLFKTNSKLSIKYFIDDFVTRFTPIATEKFDEKYVLINDLSDGQERVSVPVYNDIDQNRPEQFTYITQIRPYDHRIRAAFNDTNMTSCCDCIDNCTDRTKCACFRKTFDQALLNQDPLVIHKQKNGSSLSQIFKTMSYQRKRLLNPVSSGIYECNSKCSCHREHCSNRLLQQGLFVHLQLFKDKEKGWGLRALHDLPRGTFICQYVGELLTSDQGHERAETMDDKYQTSLDLVKQIRYDVDHDEDEDEQVDPDDDIEPYVIDGSLFSNLGKYFNHSCEPNMYIQNVFIESHDLHFPNLALFTRTQIKCGQELTWHYNCELLPDRQVKCLCGSKNCRGRLL